MGAAVTILLVGLAMAVGLVGTVLPGIPGLLVVWVAALVYGLLEGFGTAGLASMAVITVLGLAATAADVVLPGRAAGGAGAARSSLWLGALGAVVGFFALPVVGFPLGGALGIYLGEQVRTGDARSAARATRATLLGFGAAVLAEVLAGLAMVVTWAVWVLLA